jgi:hypothetical protein
MIEIVTGKEKLYVLENVSVFLLKIMFSRHHLYANLVSSQSNQEIFFGVVRSVDFSVV